MSNPQLEMDGTKRWFNDNEQRHRLDGPACEYLNGDKFWYVEGVMIFAIVRNKAEKVCGEEYRMEYLPSAMKQSISMEVLKLQ
jgi:hypothetical protein